jgi:hypothetical protein
MLSTRSTSRDNAAMRAPSGATAAAFPGAVASAINSNAALARLSHKQRDKAGSLSMVRIRMSAAS